MASGAAAGQLTVQSVDGGSCAAGQPSTDQLNGAQLLYGLQVLLSIPHMPEIRL